VLKKCMCKTTWQLYYRKYY